MLRWTHVLLVLAILAGPAWAVFPPPIKDDGKFFKPDALEKANKKIKDIYEKYHKDVVVETLAPLTADQEKKLKEEGKTKFFGSLALNRAKELGVHGIYIVFSKSPTGLHVHMDPATQKQAFTARDRKVLIDKIIARFKEKEFDAGLLDGLEVIESALKANSK
jgi:hypothetical protein